MFYLDIGRGTGITGLVRRPCVGHVIDLLYEVCCDENLCDSYLALTKREKRNLIFENSRLTGSRSFLKL